VLADLVSKINALNVNEAIAPNDLMCAPGWASHYFSVGRSAIRVILAALLARYEYPHGDAEITRICDMGCGHGRVARYLRAAFPQADIAVADYDPTGVDWCVQQFGCRAIAGPEPETFDLVWLGSVFTHLPPAIAERLLLTVKQALRPNGVLVFSTQGRYPLLLHRGREGYGFSRETTERMSADMVAHGYGYADYVGQSDYGIAIADPSWFHRRMLDTPSFMQILFQEKGWDGHQDVLGFMRMNLLGA
jgi:SAM-dependent methyltransferase